jgi:hypothetical protein
MDVPGRVLLNTQRQYSLCVDRCVCGVVSEGVENLSTGPPESRGVFGSGRIEQRAHVVHPDFKRRKGSASV